MNDNFAETYQLSDDEEGVAPFMRSLDDWLSAFGWGVFTGCMVTVGAAWIWSFFI